MQMRGSGCDWCETEVGVSGVEEGEVSDGSKGRMGHGLLHKYVSNVVVKIIRESDFGLFRYLLKIPWVRGLITGCSSWERGDGI